MKKIELTWTHEDETIVEECFLVEEDDQVFISGQETPINIITEEGIGNTAETLISIVPDYVLFEDGEGIFMLYPDQIINIKDMT